MMVRIEGPPKHGSTEGKSAWPEMISLFQYDAGQRSKVCRILGQELPLHAGRTLVFPDVSHELGLQALGAELAADMQGAFALRNVVVPWAQVEHRAIKFDERSPHQPPVVRGALERSAIGAGAAIHQIYGCGWLGNIHPQLPKVTEVN